MAEKGNAEVVAALFEAWNRGEIEGVLPFLSEDAEMEPVRAQLEGIVYRGHEGARKLYADLEEEWEGLTFDVEEIKEVDDRVVVSRCIFKPRGRASGIDLEVPLGWVIELEGGKVVRSKAYSDPDAAYREAGLEP